MLNYGWSSVWEKSDLLSNGNRTCANQQINNFNRNKLQLLSPRKIFNIFKVIDKVLCAKKLVSRSNSTIWTAFKLGTWVEIATFWLVSLFQKHFWSEINISTFNKILDFSTTKYSSNN